MKLILLNQLAGYHPIGDIVKKLLKDASKQFYHLKFLSAFLNIGGLRYLKKSLESFYDGGGTMEFIIGLDNGVTTFEALEYLKQRFPDSSVFLFQDKSLQIIFHPKVIILEGSKDIVCIIGSANLTLGGLYSNFEIASMIEMDKKSDEESIESVNALWNTYRNPSTPLHSNHLQELTAEWLTQNRQSFPTERERRESSETRSKWKFTGFGEVDYQKPELDVLSSKPFPRKRSRVQRSGKQQKGSVRTATSGQLYLEIMRRETGVDGTQIQLPTDVVTSYFRGSLSRPKHLRLSINDASFRDVYIHHFPNHTHRISINELAGIPRPAMLMFTPREEFLNSYECRILTGSNYQAALSFCTEQTRAGSRRWGIR